jgi:hypothetical protein
VTPLSPITFTALLNVWAFAGEIRPTAADNSAATANPDAASKQGMRVIPKPCRQGKLQREPRRVGRVQSGEGSNKRRETPDTGAESS